MSKKIRYSLIAFGFLIFLVSAPLLVMYVGGWIYDRPSGEFVKTGILAIKADPENSQIQLDGILTPSGSGNIKFLRPKEYAIKISKAGYFPWEKKLNILSNQVTWASPAGGKIFLFKNSPVAKILAENVLDFYQSGKTTVYLQKNKLVLLGSSGQTLKAWDLENQAQKILASPDNKTFLLIPQDPSLPAGLVSASGSKVISLPAETNNSEIQFSPDNKIYILKQNVLYKLESPFTKLVKILPSISAFSFSNKILYYVSQDPNKSLNLYGSGLNGENPSQLSSNFPSFNKIEIFSTYEKEVFLLLDNTAYKVGGGNLEILISDLSGWHTQSQNSSIAFSRGGEMSFYNPFKKNIDFVSRSTEPANLPILNFETNYMFASINNKIQALELDTRGHQNVFELYSGNQISKFSISPNNKEILVLDQGIFKKIEVR